jgi:hypothetical protein
VLDPAALKAAREVSDRGQKHLDQSTARVRVAAFGSDDQVPFLSPSESSLLQRDPPVGEVGRIFARRLGLASRRLTEGITEHTPHRVWCTEATLAGRRGTFLRDWRFVLAWD